MLIDQFINIYTQRLNEEKFQKLNPSKLSSMEMNIYIYLIKKNRIVNNNGYEVSRSKKFKYLDLLFKRQKYPKDIINRINSG